MVDIAINKNMEEIRFNTGETGDELKNKYNPEGSTLRQAQLRMLNILKFIAKVCEENNLRYWLSSGTLLGAYRHKGFIPWDDDLDIEMPREDYLKLRQIILRQNNKDYVLQDYTTDPNYYFSYAKVRDIHSFCEPQNELENLWKYRGIWIDIFILENYDVCWQKFAFYTYTYGRRFFCSSNHPLLKCIAKARFAINYYFLFPLLRLLALFFSSHKQLNNTLGTEYPLPRQLIYIYPLKKLQFEDGEFYVPNNTEGILEDHFTFDYRKLPPVELRGGHEMKIRFSE